MVKMAASASSTGTFEGFFRRSGEPVEDDFYDILGCHESSSVEQIMKEYHIKAKMYHPDRVLDDKEREHCTDIFRKINRAYEILSDKGKRQIYDNWRKSGVAMTFDNWLSLQTHLGPSMHFGTTKKQLSLATPQNEKPLHSVELKQMDTGSSLLEQFRTYKI